MSGLYTIHSRSQSTPLQGASQVVDLNDDNDEDEPPMVSQSSKSSRLPSSTMRLSTRGRARAPSDPFTDTPSGRGGDGDDRKRLYIDTGGTEEEEEDGPALRVWVVPDLSNPELAGLLVLFPAFIRRKTVPRMSVGRRKTEDEESGAESVRCGTGRMWAGVSNREEGWEGSWWRRMVMWFRQRFSM
jgi:hypothetical protein